MSPAVGPAVVVVTGGSSGIGLATARAFARRGERVVLAARSEQSLERAASQCAADGAASATYVVTDVSDEAAVERLVDEVLDRHGRIDALVHAATVMAYGEVETLPSRVFEEVVDTAVHGTAHLARHVLPVLRRQKGGTFVIVNSLVGSIVAPRMGAYATAKWGQLAIARTLQIEVRDEPDVHVCVVQPGSANTPIYYQAANWTGREPRPPWPVVQPETVANAVLRSVERPTRQRQAPWTNHLVIFGFRVLPWLFDAIVTPLFDVAARTRRTVADGDGNVFAPVGDEDREHGRWPEPAGARPTDASEPTPRTSR